jgi:hypothetical protein
MLPHIPVFHVFQIIHLQGLGMHGYPNLIHPFDAWPSSASFCQGSQVDRDRFALCVKILRPLDQGLNLQKTYDVTPG